MAANQQLALLEDFETSRPPNPLFCHQEFLEKLAEHGRNALGRRAAFLMQRLSVDIRRLHYKPTAGITAAGADRGSVVITAVISMHGGLRKTLYR